MEILKKSVDKISQTFYISILSIFSFVVLWIIFGFLAAIKDMTAEEVKQMSIEEQLRMLKDIGFSNVDCYYKYGIKKPQIRCISEWGLN